MVRTPDLKSGDPEFKSHSDQLLNLFQVVPGSTAHMLRLIALIGVISGFNT